MKPTQLFQIFWARRYLLVSVLATLVLATLVIGLLTAKEYVAEVSLLVDVKSSDLLNAVQSAPQLDAAYLATQIDVITSHNVALKVVDALKLTDNPSMRKKFTASTGGDGSMRDWMADRLLEKLAVKPSRESRVINVDFTSTDPTMAAAIANGFANGYIETSLELKIEPARHQARWFDEQLLGLRKNWQDAQQRLSLYQQSHNLVGNDGQLDVENAQLAEIARQLVTAQASMYEAQARRKQITGRQLDQSPDVLNNALLQNMKADLSRAESKLAEVEKHYGRNHPQYLGAAAEVESLKRKLNQEVGAANGSIVQASQIAQQRTTELEQALAKQKSQILALKQQYDALDVLNREVQSAQRTYEAATQRGSEVRLESQLNQSSIAILNPAVAPRRPARPKLLTNLVMAMMGGLLLGSAAALAAELLDRRVRTSLDIVDGAGLEVLAEVMLQRPPILQLFAVPMALASNRKGNLLE